MTLPQIYDLFDYWRDNPPEHELLAVGLKAYTTWRPASMRSDAAHRASLEARWKAGAMNPKQMFEAMGGRIRLDGSSGLPFAGGMPPGIGPFPGMQKAG